MATESEVRRLSVQEQQPKENISTHFVWTETPEQGGLLPPYGSHAADTKLREYYRNVFAWLAQASVAAVVRKVKQTPAEITGGGRLKSYYQQMLFFDSEFSRGWGWFLSQVLLDFLTCNYGAYAELIGAGSPKGPIRGRVMGISHLDSLRCIPTGNDDFPVVYWNYRPFRKPAMQFMHSGRVVRFVDMPDGDERFFGVGQCALYRAISMINQQTHLSAYINGQLSDMPGAGVLYNNGMTGDQWKEAYQEYMMRRKNGYKGAMVLSDPQGQLKGQLVNFAVAPDGFSYTEYIEIAVNAFAACFGIDRQDIWPLTGKMAGTATQSQVLADKANGMMFGDILKMLERFINDRVLPPTGSMEFSFGWRDDEADKLHVERTGAVVNIAASLVRDLGWTADAANQYLANNAEELRDVMTTESGELASVTDDDPAEEGHDLASPVEDLPATDDAPESDPATKALSTKTIQATRIDFEDAAADLFKAVSEEELPRRRAGIILRSLIQRYGYAGLRDGLVDGGVTDGTLDADDEARAAALLAEQSRYVTSLLDDLYSGKRHIYDYSARASMWFNKSIDPFYQAGLLSAAANANFEWVYGDTEHCSDCLRLNGQIHRLKDYHRKGWLPKAGRLACGGYNCECRLQRTTEKARGRF